VRWRLKCKRAGFEGYVAGHLSATLDCAVEQGGREACIDMASVSTKRRSITSARAPLPPDPASSAAVMLGKPPGRKSLGRRSWVVVALFLAVLVPFARPSWAMVSLIATLSEGYNLDEANTRVLLG